jgi:hypothetical protein
MFSYFVWKTRATFKKRNFLVSANFKLNDLASCLLANSRCFNTQIIFERNCSLHHNIVVIVIINKGGNKTLITAGAHFKSQWLNQLHAILVAIGA